MKCVGKCCKCNHCIALCQIAQGWCNSQQGIRAALPCVKLLKDDATVNKASKPLHLVSNCSRMMQQSTRHPSHFALCQIAPGWCNSQQGIRAASFYSLQTHDYHTSECNEVSAPCFQWNGLEIISNNGLYQWCENLWKHQVRMRVMHHIKTSKTTRQATYSPQLK